MIKIRLIVVGNLKDKFYIDASNEYQKRLNSLCDLQIVEVKESKFEDNLSQKQIEQVLEEEGKLIEKHLAGKIVVLAIEGSQMSSVEFSSYLQSAQINGSSQITFVIGSSYGISSSIKQKADLLLSFSLFTFPHRLMRVILLEQIYRAFSITKNTKYHK